MKYTYLMAAISFSVLAVSCKNNQVKKEPVQWPAGLNAPVADKKDTVLTAHGDNRTDEYYWMNDYFKKGPDSTRVVDYLKAENAYLDSMMSGTKPFQQALFAEMKGRIREKDESVPVLNNGYYYYTRTEEGQQYYKYCRKKGNLEAPEEVLLDVDQMAAGSGYFSVAGFNVSPDNKLIAYGIDKLSRRQYTIYVKNLETGEVLSDEIPGTAGNPVWAADNKTLFYTSNNPVTLLSEKIRKHKLGTEASADAAVYEEKDPSNYIGVYATKSKAYIVIYSSATLSSEYRILEADKPDNSFRIFQPRIKDVLYSFEHWKNKFLIRTNLDAKNFRLMETPVDNTGKEYWKEVIAHRPDVLLEDIEVFRDHWVITERKEGLLQMRIRDAVSGKEHYLDFGEPAYAAYVGANPEFNSSTFRYNYTSLTTPNSVYDYDLLTKNRKLMKEQPVLGGFNKDEYITERVFATARDGARVPVSIVYKKGTKKDGSAPLLLYGYGSYGASMDASFNSNRLSLLNRGFIYAIAHIRGGQEMGRQWYEDGKLLKKKNTFTDFIDCGEFLVKEKYTSKGHLYAMGGSAGGLLMGAIVNMAPDLWNGVVAQVPFVDVLTTMSDPSIPLTTNEYDEWGNPANKEAYFYMKSYSPYDNVEKKNYPNLLITTGLHDSQVQYFEPSKWVARLRAMKTDKKLLLFKTNMEAGHGGASGRFDYLKDVALQYAFLTALEGITE
ncbi:MAG: S9 family peptidase [Sphingobacteriales bacterium]|nr:S9 family peptidase [Sphingobacteriales bacterium]